MKKISSIIIGIAIIGTGIFGGIKYDISFYWLVFAGIDYLKEAI